MENPDYIYNQIYVILLNLFKIQKNLNKLEWFPKILVENKRNDILEIFI